MAHEDIPILVVDDAKFSSAVIAKALRDRGCRNLRFTDDPQQALRALEKRPAHILIADWLMPGMDGLELTRRVKQLDQARQHYTYVMLLTARDEPEAMDEAFLAGADDFVNKSELRAELLPRIISARRIAASHNELLRGNRLLRNKLRELQSGDVVDPITGLGNLSFSLERITATTRQVEARGGAACLLLVGISNLATIREHYDPAAVSELISGIGAKLRQLVRPLDLVTHPEAGTFAVITHQPNLEVCTSSSFRRIFDGLYMHSFKTSEGYIPVVVGVGISAADAGTGLPPAEKFMEHAQLTLARSFDTGLVTVQTYTADQQSPTPVS
ncbi:MAG: response regulator [Pseudomonadales bacterium]